MNEGLRPQVKARLLGVAEGVRLGGRTPRGLVLQGAGGIPVNFNSERRQGAPGVQRPLRDGFKCHTKPFALGNTEKFP